ncbi:hypothetical protein BC940DRAFT_122419 [Gongronella butleri]|nr:hypothetical protein BC940DRAFT_122419 [Gongronella butleri]
MLRLFGATFILTPCVPSAYRQIDPSDWAQCEGTWTQYTGSQIHDMYPGCGGKRAIMVGENAKHVEYKHPEYYSNNYNYNYRHPFFVIHFQKKKKKRSAEINVARIRC